MNTVFRTRPSHDDSTPESSCSRPVGYADGGKMYVEFSAAYKQAARMWRSFAFAAMMVASLSIVGNIYQAQLPRLLPSAQYSRNANQRRPGGLPGNGAARE